MAGLGSLVVGVGMGLSSSASIILIQEIVSWSERGSVTASYLFARSPAARSAQLCSAPCSISGFFGQATQGRRLSSFGNSWSKVREAVGEPGLRAALEQSLHLTFVSMFGVALMVAATMFLVPKVVFAPRGVPAE